MFASVVDETNGLRIVEERRCQRRTESTSSSHSFYLLTAKILHTVTTVRDTLIGKSRQNTG